MVNTGTWLKRLHRRDGIIGVLPPVFYPSYQLASVRIAAEPEGVAVEFEQIKKPSPATEELTWTERFSPPGERTRVPRQISPGDGAGSESGDSGAGDRVVTALEIAPIFRSQSEAGQSLWMRGASM